MLLDVTFSQNDKKLKAEFDGVQNISDGGYERGLAEGYANGKAEGITEGRAEGQEIGYADALAKRTDLVVTENGEYTPTEDSTGFKSVSVNVPNKLAQLADESITEITAEDLRGATKIRKEMFKLCLSLKSVVIPNSVTVISSSAFCGEWSSRMKIKTIEFEEESALAELMSSSFGYCSSVKSVVLPRSLQKIGYWAFSYGDSLKTITMQASIPPTLDSSAFYQCGSISQIIVPIGCGDAYKSATNWSALADKIVEGDV